MTNPNPSPKNRFTKGDKRINRDGRPKNGGGLGWQPVEYVGFLSMGNPAWLTVEDGPQ